MNISTLMNRIDTVIRFFLYVMIFWIPFSSAVIESCVIPAFLLLCIKRLLQIKTKVSSVENPLNLAMGSFILIAIFSALGSLEVASSLRGLITKMLEWFVIFLLVLEVFKERKHVYIALLLVTASAVATAVDGIIQYHWTYRDIFLNHLIVPGDRAAATFKTPNGLGAYLILTIPVLSGFLLAQKGKFKYYSSILIGTPLLWALIVSGSRGAILGVSIGLLFFVYFGLVKKNEIFGLESLA